MANMDMDLWNPHLAAYADDPIKIQVLLRIQRDEEEESEDADEAIRNIIEENDSELKFLRSKGDVSEKVIQNHIALTLEQFKWFLKTEKYKAYILQLAPPSEIPRLLLIPAQGQKNITVIT